jgi:hypothetical protein
MSRTVRPEGAEGTPSTARSGREIRHSPHPEDESSGSIPLPFQGTTPKAYLPALIPPHKRGKRIASPACGGLRGVERNSPAPQPLIGGGRT